MMMLLLSPGIALPTNNPTTPQQSVPDELWETILLRLPIEDFHLPAVLAQFNCETRKTLCQTLSIAHYYLTQHRMRALMKSLDDRKSPLVVNYLARYQLHHYGPEQTLMHRLCRLMIDERNAEAFRLLTNLHVSADKGTEFPQSQAEQNDGFVGNLLRISIFQAIKTMQQPRAVRLQAIEWLMENRLISASDGKLCRVLPIPQMIFCMMQLGTSIITSKHWIH
jgi:hypothetical protein